MEGPESFSTVRQKKHCLLLYKHCLLLYKHGSSDGPCSLWVLSLTHSLSHISHQHEQKEEAFARGEIVGGEDP